MVIVAVKVTWSTVIHSPCACAMPCSIKLLFASTIFIGNDASKYQGPGAWPETTKVLPTAAFGFGDVTITRSASVGVEVATGGVVVAVMGGVGIGIAKSAQVSPRITINTAIRIPVQSRVFMGTV